MKNPSLRRRLLVLLLSATLAAWTFTAIKNYFDNRYEIAELFDAQLAQSARALLALSVHELHEQLAFESHQNQNAGGREISEVPTTQVHKYEQRVAFQIWTKDGRLAVRSQSAPLDPLIDHPGDFSDRTINGERWRVYGLVDSNLNVQVQVGEHYEQRDQLNRDIALRLLAAVVLSLPLLAVMISLGVNRAMVPLKRVARAVSKRELGNLKPIDYRDVPDETQPLITALNDLFRRLQLALDNILNFTANAAHELRTPLAALRTHAQVALRAQTEIARTEALHDVIRGVDRATYLLEQLLTLSRLDPELVNIYEETTNLADVAQTVLAELTPHALEKNIDISLTTPYRGAVAGKEAMLGILIRNLTENAIRYSPKDGSVEVSIFKQGPEVILRVADSGPGIPVAEREKVFKRFYRSIDSSTTAGSGLGLSIVQRIIEIHNAKAELGESRHHGLQFDVHFTPTPAKNSAESKEPMQRTG